MTTPTKSAGVRSVVRRAPQAPAGHAGPARRPPRQGKLTPWIFMAVALLSEGIFTVFPFLNTIVLAFTDATRLRGGQFTGFDNFTRMVHDDRFWTALENSALYMVVVVPCMVFLPLLLAMLVNTKLPGAGFFRTTYYVPVVSSTVAVGIMWSWLLDSQGLVNQTLEALGFISRPIPFLTDHWLLMGSAMFVTVWTGLGWYMVIYLAALTNVSKDLYEAAALDGAGWWRRFVSVTIPGVRNTMVLVAALSSVAAFRVFTEIYVLSGNSAGPGGSAMTIIMLIQRVGTGLDADVGYASALSIVVFVITIGLMIAVLRMQTRENEK
ncbi:sugar ABC transporter permease [Streptomyces sp. NPDC051840]|uniref:carbohydrate ABC transporter permease n=1 Tax=unclassified Streptomyces TaxID=2593676 RepID=UPI003437DF71